MTKDKRITKARAVKLAVEALHKQMKPYLFDANTAIQFYNAEEWTPTQISAIDKVKEYTEAIEIIETLGRQQTFIK